VRWSKFTIATGLLWATVVLAASPFSPVPQQPATALSGEYKPPPAPEQPIPYSHKTHLAQGLQCVLCHETAESDEHATIPPTSTCMGCHSRVKTDSPHIQALTSWNDKEETVPWRRVYRLPDYVYFSHKQHVADAKVTCDVCHGNVAAMDQMQRVKDISMAACLDCHKSRSAPTQCDSCHETQ
jgi:Cytochrome c7 and related cytochrome c